MGVPEFRLADLVHDYRALETARNDATDIVQNKRWNEPDFQPLKSYVQSHFTLESDLLN